MERCINFGENPQKTRHIIVSEREHTTADRPSLTEETQPYED